MKNAYTGPAFLSFGFRPFFLFGAIWAAVTMLLWLGLLAGRVALPTPFEAASWHAHEMIFGYGGAIVCGFLLTAVPNWTGRYPVNGAPLAALAGLWLAGRLAVSLGGALPAAGVAAIDLAFPAALSALIAREIIAGRNWRNLPVLALVVVLLLGNAAFHWSAAHGGFAAGGAGARAGLGALVMLIALIGGRVVPSFTRNWLVKQGSTYRPAAVSRFDSLALLAAAVSLALWVPAPDFAVTRWLLLAVGLMHLARLARWGGWHTFSEPLVTVLHLAYLFVPLGFILSGMTAFTSLSPIAGLHTWATGAVGLMTLAMMTRASLGHSGRALHAGAVEVTIYSAVLAAAVLRVGGAAAGSLQLTNLAGIAWVVAFALFAVAYWPVLTRPRIDRKRPNPRPVPATEPPTPRARAPE